METLVQERDASQSERIDLQASESDPLDAYSRAVVGAAEQVSP